MDLLILVIALAAGFFTWRYVSNSSQRRGKGKGKWKATVIALLAFFFSIGILLETIQPASYLKSQADTAAKAKAKAEADAVEAAKTIEMRAAEKVAVAAAEFEQTDRKETARSMCIRYVRAGLKAPSTATFPMNDLGMLKHPRQIYIIQSSVDAQNEFGAMLRSHWRCEVRYKGGDESDSDNWTLLNLHFIQL